MLFSGATSLTTIILALASLLIPLLSSLVGRQHWPPEVLGILTVVFSTAAGLVAEWAQAGDAFDWRRGVTLAVSSFVVAVLGRFALWKNTNTDAKALAVGSGHPAAP